MRDDVGLCIGVLQSPSQAIPGMVVPNIELLNPHRTTGPATGGSSDSSEIQ